jgi:hypothetical protein
MSLVANAYAHCLDEVQLHGPQPRAFATALGELGRTAAAGVLGATLMDEVWRLIQKGVAAHLIPNYQRRLKS